MWYKIFLNITRNEIFKEVMITLSEAAMVIFLLLALLSTDVQEINFVYANF